MHVVIESKAPITEARRLLANVIARDTFEGLAGHIERIRFVVAEGIALPRSCDLHLELANGTELACDASADNMADALERATHIMRVKVLRALGLPLPTRRQPDDFLIADRRTP